MIHYNPKSWFSLIFHAYNCFASCDSAKWGYFNVFNMSHESCSDPLRMGALIAALVIHNLAVASYVGYNRRFQVISFKFFGLVVRTAGVLPSMAA